LRLRLGNMCSAKMGRLGQIRSQGSHNNQQSAHKAVIYNTRVTAVLNARNKSNRTNSRRDRVYVKRRATGETGNVRRGT
jgi:hypothetical protein